MTNEAAERLRSYVGNHPAANKLVDAALAAERTATVERIRTEILFQRNRFHVPPEKLRVIDLLAILDAEAAREGVQ